MAVVVSDTATEVLAVGIRRSTNPDSAARMQSSDIQVDYSSTALVPRAHSRWLQPTIQHGLKVCQVPVEDVDIIGVGVGPGSYTGVRLAVSTAKAMAMALGAQLMPIPTLLTLAEAVPRPQNQEIAVLSLLNARRNRAFGALYVLSQGRWRAETPIQVQDLDDWPDVAQSSGYTWTRTDTHLHVAHDFSAAPWQAERRDGVCPEGRMHRLRDISSGLPAAMMRLVMNGDVRGVAGDDIHTVVPEYALLVEAESRLAERGGQAVDSN